MITNNLKAYIAAISHNVITPIDQVIYPKDEKMIYRLIVSFATPDKITASNKFIKRIINKLRMMDSVIFEKTDRHRYIVEQKMNNGVLCIDYKQGELKDRYKEAES